MNIFKMLQSFIITEESKSVTLFLLLGEFSNQKAREANFDILAKHFLVITGRRYPDSILLRRKLQLYHKEKLINLHARVKFHSNL